MLKSCWCYTTDHGYLLPTLLSAMQLRKKISTDQDDVVIIYIGAQSNIVAAAQHACASENIKFVLQSKSAIDHSPMICARLFMDRLLTEKYEYITYLDGDTQITGDVQKLSEALPRSGSLLAALDVMGLMIGDPRPLWRDCDQYFDQIGLAEGARKRYFNSGVIKVSMSDWEVISKECLLMLSKPVAINYAFRDQDALNIILNGKHEVISFRWNWPGFFFKKGIDRIVSPNIVHFMSRPRPWDGSFPPWGTGANSPYRELIRHYPALKGLYQPAKGLRYLRYQAQQRWKGYTEDYNSSTTHDRIRASELKSRL